MGVGAHICVHRPTQLSYNYDGMVVCRDMQHCLSVIFTVVGRLGGGRAPPPSPHHPKHGHSVVYAILQYRR